MAVTLVNQLMGSSSSPDIPKEVELVRMKESDGLHKHELLLSAAYIKKEAGADERNVKLKKLYLQ